MAAVETVVAEDIKDFIHTPTKTGVPIIKKINSCIEKNKVFYSFEFFPPKRREAVQNLYTRIESMSCLEPLFLDITWGAGGTTADLTLEIANHTQNFNPAEVMMHLTCTNMSIEMIRNALESAKEAGVRNILALRGDPPKGAENWEKCENGFSNAVDLVRYIRSNYGDYFGIAVAGYPEGHIQAVSLSQDIQYLKEKCDAGADFIVTQLFYDVDLYIDWVRRCREVGITIPIIPGIMPIQSYPGFMRMTSFCQTKVPQEILDALEPIKDDEEAVKAYGIELCTQMCRRLLANGTPGLHFYTLNLERSCTQILETLGYVTSKQSVRLPWKQSLLTRRQDEQTRPIFWANRPQVYFDRTKFWDEFPNGRWGDSSSPAFGDLTDYHLCSFRMGSRADRLKIWGEVSKPIDIFTLFAKYIDGQVARLPWCEDTLQLETTPLKTFLQRINQHGFLTINSQPKVNAAPSTDANVGWGGPNGYVYQKAYLEFFTSQANVNKLAKLAAEYPFISYTAVNVAGNVITNLHANDQGVRPVNVVTWGVFPNKKVLQTTVVDVDSFLVWKDEAFALWISQWQSIYDEQSVSWSVIQEIHDTFYLVNIVDNDYVNGDMTAFFEKLLK